MSTSRQPWGRALLEHSGSSLRHTAVQGVRPLTQKAHTSVCFMGHRAVVYLRNCIKINDSLFLNHFASGPQGIHCSNNSFDFSHQGMMQLSNGVHINTSLPFREHTPFWIVHCNLEITLTCGIIQLGVLIREAGISPSIVQDPWVFLLWCKLASIFPSSLLLFLSPLFIYKALEAHTCSWPRKRNVFWLTWHCRF